jgi:tRNA threonylcarbamoyladenosine modification (KEOPS) complex  Pcc1 subunit
MRARSSLTLVLDPRDREAVLGAMAPEVGSPPEGTTVLIERSCGDGSKISVLIESEDLSSHRAAVNSYLGLLQAALASLEGGP